MAGSPDCSRNTHRPSVGLLKSGHFTQIGYGLRSNRALQFEIRCYRLGIEGCVEMNVTLSRMLHWVRWALSRVLHWIECNRQLDTISNYPAWFMSQNRDRSDCFKSSRRLALQIKQMHFAKSSETHIQISKFCGDLELLYKAKLLKLC